MMDIIVQFCIVVFGLVAIWITQQPNKSLYKYASVFGILSQPAFFYATYTAEQWGMFFLSVCYLVIWCRGFYHHWIVLPKIAKTESVQV